MPEFKLDTSGTVNPPSPLSWSDLDAFTQGYIEAMFFTDASGIAMTEWHSDEAQECISEGQADGNIPEDAGFSDLEPATLARIILDCDSFQQDHAADLESVYSLPPGPHGGGDTIDARRSGQFFWYARNGHGVSWSDDFPRGSEGADLLERMQKASRKTGNVDAYFSDENESSPTGYGFVCL